MKNIFYSMVIVWWIASILFSSLSYSQADEMQFERISIESGLSQSCILCICQDSKGFLWFGTFEGLNRYDGYRFKVYKSDSKNPFSLSNNSVTSVIEDHLGILWVGTEEGLNCFDRENDKFISYKNDPGDPNSLSNNLIRYVYEDQSGTLWVGTNGGGLNQFDREKKQFIHYLFDPNNPKSLDQNDVCSILEDSKKRLWIGTDGGLNCFDRYKKEFKRYQNNPQDPHSLSPNGIWTIYEDHLGNLWLGTWGGGLNLFDPKSGHVIRYQNIPKDPASLSDNIVRTIFEDQNGNLLVGSANKGLNKFVPGSKGNGSGTFMLYQNDPEDPTSLSSNSILSNYKDKSGILWIGTNFGGLNKYNPNQRKFILYRNHPNKANSLSKNSIQAIVEDSQGLIWIGTDGKGLDCLDRKKNRFTHYINNPYDPYSLSSNIIRSICEDRYNNLWIGTVDGLNYFDRKKNKFICYRNDANNPRSISNSTAWTVYKDRTGNIWVGTFGGGLNRFDYATGEFTRYIHDQNDPKSISDNFIWTIYEDSSGTYWIGTLLGGLDRFDPKKGVFSHYQIDIHDSTSISNNKVLCLYEDHAGVIWAGTINGLNKFDRTTGTFHVYTENDGLSNNNIQGLLEDDHGNLWIGTNFGLSKFNPRTLKFKNYNESYGLQSNEFSVNACCKLKNGEMAFGGVNGLNIFHPDSIGEDTALPTVVITDFQIFNKPVVVGENAEGRTILIKSISDCDEVHLSYKDNVFSLEFAALHYTSPKDNLYAYMMEGFETEWNYTDASRRFVTYTNLPGGTYTFRVKASNNQGNWNNEGTSVRIIITPPFWKTIWFYGLLLIVFLGIVYWIYQWRVQARDLAAQRRLEAAVTRERNLLRTLINNIPDPVYAKDTDYRKTIANIADVETMGLHSEADVLGKNDFDLFPKEIAEESLADDRSIIQDGLSVFNKEVCLVDKNSQKKWFLTTKVPLRDENNKIIGLVGVGKDITKRKQYEEHLQNERNLLRTLIDNIPDYIYIKDIKGQFVVANMALAHQSGCKSPEELVGKSELDIFPREMAEKFIVDEQEVIQSGHGLYGYEGPAIDLSKEEKERWISAIKVPFRDAQGGIIGIIGINRDITERKKAESEREKLITQLQEALADVKLLSGLVPICANCKKIRDDQGYWTQIESYIQDRSDAKFSHSICPDCAKKLYPQYLGKK